MKGIIKFILVSGIAVMFGDQITATSLRSASAADYYVVVNESNTFSGTEDEARALIRRLYLKSIKNWPGGQVAVPFARKDAGPVQQATLQALLSMSEAEHGQHWARQKQTTGDTPPRAVGSKSILLRLIKREPGAVGIIDASGPEPEGVKVLLKFSS